MVVVCPVDDNGHAVVHGIVFERVRRAREREGRVGREGGGKRNTDMGGEGGERETQERERERQREGESVARLQRWSMF